MSRPKGTTKEIMTARRNLEVINKLKEIVGEEEVVDAVNKLLATMRDPNSGAATARLCAKDVIEIYYKLHKDSLELLAEVKEKSPSPEKPEQATASTGTGKLITLTYNKDDQ